HLSVRCTPNLWELAREEARAVAGCLLDSCSPVGHVYTELVGASLLAKRPVQSLNVFWVAAHLSVGCTQKLCELAHEGASAVAGCLLDSYSPVGQV
ncbi:hypothetical protein ALQ44_04005, partial [Pseudomonas syringae pv. pisi]